MKHDQLNVRQKALTFNLNPNTYGAFAEIGAGQEVASLFFKAGAASGTVAKTMSAYDKTVSDAIYGKEESGRYVCESRLVKMMDREYSLMEERLKGVRPPDTLFFAFANTIVTLNFSKSNEGHGWVGIRFQLVPDSEPNDIIMHIKMLDSSTDLQQQAVGIIGVNLIYGAFYYHHNIELLINSLLDQVGNERIEIDMLRISGPQFKKVDNRLVALLLVKNNLTNAALFDPEGNVLQPSDAFYKKNVFLLRGRFRPCTNVNMDMIGTGHQEFLNDRDVNPGNIFSISELTLNNLQNEGQIIEKDFLDRVEILCSLGQNVLISNYHEYYRLVAYLSGLSKQKIGIVLGIGNLAEVFNEEYYKNLKGGILESFSTLFSRNVKLYVYPMKQKDGTLQTCENFPIAPHLFHLYQYLLFNDKIADIRGVELSYLDIYSDNVLKMIKAGENGWESMVPSLVYEAIVNKELFGFAAR
jgi:hypothetical protein